MHVITCEMFALCVNTATGLINNPVVGVVASCDQHGHLTRVPPAAQYRAYTVPGVGEVTVMIGEPFEDDTAEQVSLFRMYLPDGTGTQGTGWSVVVNGDADSDASGWRLLWTMGTAMGEADDPAVSGPAKLVAEYAGAQVERIETAEQDRVRVLREAAPVGTTVIIEPHREDGLVRLYVETGDPADGVTHHRLDNPTGINHITYRVAQLLGADYYPDHDAVRGDGLGLVGWLSLRLHGATGALFPAVSGDEAQRDRVLSRYLD